MNRYEVFKSSCLSLIEVDRAGTIQGMYPQWYLPRYAEGVEV